MKMFKESRDVEGWIVEIGGKEYPLDSIKISFYILMVALLIVNAYNMGSIDAKVTMQNLAKGLSYCTDTGRCSHCEPIAEGNKIKVQCYYKDGSQVPTTGAYG